MAIHLPLRAGLGTRSGMTINTLKRSRVEAYVLYALGFLFLPVAALATAQIWVLALIGVVAIIALRITHENFWPRSQRLLIMLLALLIGWAALSNTWTINPDRGVKTAIRLVLVGVSLVFLVDAATRLNQAERQTFGQWLVSGTIVGLALTGMFIGFSNTLAEWFGLPIRTGHELDRLNRTASVIAILVWPVALTIAQLYGRYAAAAVIVLSAAALFLLAPSAPLVAFAIGIVIFVIAWFSQRWGKRLLFIGFAVAVAAVPFLDLMVPVINDWLITNILGPNSEVHRFLIWEFASQRIFEQPLFGWGLEASRNIPGGHDQLILFQFGENPTTGQAMPLHPHNALVQIWLELGLVGLILTTALFSMVVVSIPESMRNRAQPATMIATTACAFTIAELGFGIWQGWWMATLGLTAMIIVAGAPAGSDWGAHKPPADD